MPPQSKTRRRSPLSLTPSLSNSGPAKTRRWRHVSARFSSRIRSHSRPHLGCSQLVLDGLGGGCLLGCRWHLGGGGGLLALLDEVDDVVRRPAAVVGCHLPARGHEVQGRVALDVKLTGNVIGSRVLGTLCAVSVL